jgi:hypothetical protein
MGSRQILIAAKAAIQVPTRWTQGCLARDLLGCPCSTNSTGAEQFSILGAIDRAARLSRDFDGADEAYRAVANVLALKLGHPLPRKELGYKVAIELLNAFNDIATHASVLQLLDNVIERTDDLSPQLSSTR